ncbi:MAG: inositol monophosphatase [Opitutaceae bacterium]
MRETSESELSGLDLEAVRDLLESFQVHLRDRILETRKMHHPDEMGEVAAVMAADTIYRIDRISEESVLDWFDANWPPALAAELVMEGLEDSERRIVPLSAAGTSPRLKVIIDPIDGTRGLIHDKRPAWILTGVAIWRGEATMLDGILVAVMTEVPTTRQWRSDQVSALRGGGETGVRAMTHDLVRGGRKPARLRRSESRSFEHGFATFARFLPEGKALLAAFEEEFWRVLSEKVGPFSQVFEDQYISTGGQLYELMAGHDRMVGDLRPLAFRRLGLKGRMVCHPYDICTSLILEEMGGMVVGPDGGPLRPGLNTTEAVSWIGFANPDLAGLALPVIRSLLPDFF